MKALNTLWVRLTLAFAVIILAAIGAVAILINRTADTQFRQYVTHSGISGSGSSLQQLAAYYDQAGSWEGVGTLFAEGVLAPEPTTPPGREWRSDAVGKPRDIVLADAEGKVVFTNARSPVPKRLGSAQRAMALPITALEGESTIGYLLLALPGAPDRLGSLEQRFLNRIRGALLAGVALAAGLALIVDALLSRSLTAPLQRLAAAARAVADGELGQQVKVEGTTEIAEVAYAFNEMTSALEKAEKQRQNLVADIAHELRTPLSVLQGNLRAILDDVYPLEKSEIARLYDETLLLSRLVGDLRELAQAEAGQLGLNLRATNIGDVLKAASGRFAPAAEAKGIHLNLFAADDLPPVQADPDRLAQVVSNLLSNALSHTPDGGQVTVMAAIASDAQDVIEVVVADTGEGIAPQDLPHVFDRFWRADRSRSRETGGSGLGLAIARSLVEFHGGRIWVESTPGQGARFTFRLPVTPAVGGKQR